MTKGTPNAKDWIPMSEDRTMTNIPMIPLMLMEEEGIVMNIEVGRCIAFV